VIVLDVNILIYAYSSDVSQHHRARAWMETAFSGDEPVRIPWAVAHAFLRLTTKSKFLLRPLRIEQAAAIVDEWFSLPVVAPLEPGPKYWPILRELVISTNSHGNLVSDAHIAALAIEHGATVCSADSDFSRFGVRVINPLA
jgi:uncharacterized protein